MNRHRRVLVMSIVLVSALLLVASGAMVLARIVFNASRLSTVAAMHRAIERGRIEHAIILRFEQQFGSGEHSISYFTGEYGPSAWHSEWSLRNAHHVSGDDRRGSRGGER